MSEITAGDIVAVSGLKFSNAGDTIVDIKDIDNFILEDLKMPPPVF